MYLENIFLVMLAIAAAAFAMQSWGVTLDTLPGDLFPPERVAQVVGLCGFLGSIGGVAFTALTGYIVQRYSYAPIWVASAMMYPAGLLCMRILMPVRRGSEVPRPASS
jgi:ACS family hexuronate transporter-like MFS transporter